MTPWLPKVLWGSTVGYPSDSLASCFSCCQFSSIVLCVYVMWVNFVGQCSDEGRSFISDVPDSPAAAAFQHIITGLLLLRLPVTDVVDWTSKYFTSDRLTTDIDLWKCAGQYLPAQYQYCASKTLPRMHLVIRKDCVHKVRQLRRWDVLWVLYSGLWPGWWQRGFRLSVSHSSSTNCIYLSINLCLWTAVNTMVLYKSSTYSVHSVDISDKSTVHNESRQCTNWTHRPIWHCYYHRANRYFWAVDQQPKAKNRFTRNWTTLCLKKVAHYI